MRFLGFSDWSVGLALLLLVMCNCAHSCGLNRQIESYEWQKKWSENRLAGGWLAAWMEQVKQQPAPLGCCSNDWRDIKKSPFFIPFIRSQIVPFQRICLPACQTLLVCTYDTSNASVGVCASSHLSLERRRRQHTAQPKSPNSVRNMTLSSRRTEFQGREIIKWFL